MKERAVGFAFTSRKAISILALSLFAYFPGVGAAYAQASTGPGPKAYIGLFKDNAVAVLDTATLGILKTIPVAAGPHGIVAGPEGKNVYVSSDGGSVVSVIDTGSDTVASAIEVGKSPHGLAITPDGRTLLVADFGTDTVVFIDTTSMKIIGRTASPSPHNIAIGPDGDVAYVGDQAKGKTAIQVLDIASMKEKAGVPLDKAPRALGLNKDGSKLYFTLAGADEVQVLDTKSLSLAKTIPVGASPHHPLFTADGTLALVVSQGPGELSIIDAASDTVLARVKVGKLPHWIAQSSDGRRAFVTNEGSNDISIVDLDTRSLTGTVAVGSAPRKIAVIGKAALGAAPLRTTIAAFAFADTLKAAVGQSVVWTNADAVPHTVTGDGGLWDSGDIEGGKSFTMRFDKPGTYSYYCKYHPLMRGTVLVGAAE